MIDVLAQIPADTGCEAAASCLRCPLPMCRHDDPAGYIRYRRRERDGRIAAAYYGADARTTVADFAAGFGVSARTIQRALRRVQQEAVS